MKLPKAYYQTSDVVGTARDLLGKVLFTKMENRITAGIISETEAYAGTVDRASHAYGGRRTKRTEVMFGEGGYSYVYLCYGIHHLFNVVTGPAEKPHAILVRGILPYLGKEVMAERLDKKQLTSTNTDGPGKLSKALGITIHFNNRPLTGDEIWIEERELPISTDDIRVSRRIGVDYAKEDALLPYRFNLIHEKVFH